MNGSCLAIRTFSSAEKKHETILDLRSIHTSPSAGGAKEVEEKKKGRKVGACRSHWRAVKKES